MITIFRNGYRITPPPGWKVEVVQCEVEQEPFGRVFRIALREQVDREWRADGWLRRLLEIVEMPEDKIREEVLDVLDRLRQRDDPWTSLQILRALSEMIDKVGFSIIDDALSSTRHLTVTQEGVAPYLSEPTSAWFETRVRLVDYLILKHWDNPDAVSKLLSISPAQVMATRRRIQAIYTTCKDLPGSPA